VWLSAWSTVVVHVCLGIPKKRILGWPLSGRHSLETAISSFAVDVEGCSATGPPNCGSCSGLTFKERDGEQALSTPPSSVSISEARYNP